MLKLYNRKSSLNNSSQKALQFDGINERYIKYLKLIQSSNDKAVKLREQISSAVASSGQSYYDALQSIIRYYTSYWHIPISADDDVILAQFGEFRKALKKGKNSNRPLLSHSITSPDGEQLPIDDYGPKYIKNVDVSQITSNYKDYLKGIYYVVDNYAKKIDPDRVSKTLYCVFLHMVNKESIYNFLPDTIIRNTQYKNNKQPNAILGRTASDDDPFNKIIKLTGKYICTQTRLTDDQIDFYKNLYFLLTEILGLKILNASENYSESEIEDEMNALVKYTPLNKFSPNFVDKTISIEEWFSLSYSDITNEYSIKEYNNPAELGENIKPLSVATTGFKSFKREKELLAITSLYHTLGTVEKESVLCSSIYNYRIGKIKREHSTYETWLEVSDETKNIKNSLEFRELDGEILFETLGQKILEFQIKNPGAVVTDEVKGYLEEIIKSTIEDQVNRIYKVMCKFNKHNLKMIDNLHLFSTLKNSAEASRKVSNGLLRVLNKPLVLNITLLTYNSGENRNKEIKNIRCYITGNYLLVTENKIILPESIAGIKTDFKINEAFSYNKYIDLKGI